MAKLNIDKATVRQLFKAVIKASDEFNKKSIVYGQAKRVLPLRKRPSFMCRMVIMTALR